MLRGKKTKKIIKKDPCRWFLGFAVHSLFLDESAPDASLPAQDQMLSFTSSAIARTEEAMAEAGLEAGCGFGRDGAITLAYKGAEAASPYGSARKKSR